MIANAYVLVKKNQLDAVWYFYFCPTKPPSIDILVHVVGGMVTPLGGCPTPSTRLTKVWTTPRRRASSGDTKTQGHQDYGPKNGGWTSGDTS